MIADRTCRSVSFLSHVRFERPQLAGQHPTTRRDIRLERDPHARGTTRLIADGPSALLRTPMLRRDCLATPLPAVRKFCSTIIRTGDAGID